MDKIPHDLVRYLMELGLLESEARIYIALTMMNNSEVKNLIDFLGLSKPNTYESLRLLEEKGLVVLINTKPMTYQATPPDIGLEMLLKTHINAKEEAKYLFSTLDKNEFVEKSPETLWYVFGGKSIDYKIKDMIQNAKNSIFVATSYQYIKYLKKIDGSNLKLDIIYISDHEDEEGLKNIIRNENANISVVTEGNMIGSSMAAIPENELLTYTQALEMFEYDNMMMLIVDDSELLFIPPVSKNSISAVNTKNKAMIMIMKIEFRALQL